MTGFWLNKRVLLTGHTGFKGSWLSLWLNSLGAKVYGFALEPDTIPALFNQAKIEKIIDHQIGDIRNRSLVNDRVQAVKPHVVIHLAAQPLVRRSYRDPLLTWQTNVMGTIHLLEALRNLDQLCAVVIATTDKVYENLGKKYVYTESDRLGGIDPYSSSKAGCELAVDSWRESFFRTGSNIRIATARAGNVIGGGDWAEDRIVPDLMRGACARHSVAIRNIEAVRPWQHVLEPLSGYMTLAQQLYGSNSAELQEAFNFGPNADSFKTVSDLIDEINKSWAVSTRLERTDGDLHEAQFLALSTEKATKILDWVPSWNFAESVKHTVTWYKNSQKELNCLTLCMNDIHAYEEKLKSKDQKT